MDPFALTKFYSKKKFLKLVGGEIRIYHEDQTQLLLFVKQKAWKLKEDITVYSDESESRQILKINARQIIDFSAAYDVTDALTRAKFGVLRRKGFRSIFRDHWEIMGPNDNPIGEVVEDSKLFAFLRRFLTNLIPQTFNIILEGKTVGILKQRFNPFVALFDADFSMDENNRLSRQMGLAILILLQIIEGRQG